MKEEKPKEPKWELKIGGYCQIQYEDDKAKAVDNLRIRRLMLNFDGKLPDEKLFYRASIDLKRLSGYLGYEFGGKAKLKLTVGEHSVPFGFDHTQSSSARLIAERSKVTLNLAPARDIGGGDIGISLHGKYPVDFWIGIFQGGAEIDPKNKIYKASGVEKVDDHKDFALRAVYKDLGVKGLNVGISHYEGYLGTSTKEPYNPLVRRRTGGDLLFTKGNISLQTEYMAGEDPIGAKKEVLSKTIKKAGWYFQGAYKLDVILQGLQVVSRYGFWDSDTDKDDNEETQLTIAAVYDFTKHGRLLLDYTRNTEKPTDLDNDITILRYQIKF